MFYSLSFFKESKSQRVKDTNPKNTTIFDLHKFFLYYKNSELTIYNGGSNKDLLLWSIAQHQSDLPICSEAIFDLKPLDCCTSGQMTNCKSNKNQIYIELTNFGYGSKKNFSAYIQFGIRAKWTGYHLNDQLSSWAVRSTHCSFRFLWYHSSAQFISEEWYHKHLNEWW